MWFRFLYAAKSRDIKVNITIQDAWNKIVKQEFKCVISGQTISLPENRDDERKYNFTASIDRIDTCKPYDIDNFQWVHKDINRIKWDMSVSELLEWVRIIYKFNELDKIGLRDG